MICRVEFRNFKALREVSLDLEQFTVLVGPNASGKTTVLEGLHLLAEFGSERTKGISQPTQISLQQRTSDSDGEIYLVGSDDTSRVIIAINEALLDISATGPSSGGIECSTVVPVCEPEVPIRISPLQGKPDFGPAIFLRMDAGRLAEASYSDEEVPRMDADGYGLPSVLAYMASDHPESYEEILKALRSVVPTFRDMRFPRAKVVRKVSEIIEVGDKTISMDKDREYWGNSIEFDMESGRGISADMASEGTLLVLGLLTVLMGPERPRLVLLDDVDRALHPKAQEELVRLLRKLLADSPGLQIVATSHSPYLLDHFKPEEVRLTTLKSDGTVAIGRLDEHPTFEKWKKEMSPGEFWSMVGEKWITEAAVGEQG